MTRWARQGLFETNVYIITLTRTLNESTWNSSVSVSSLALLIIHFHYKIVDFLWNWDTVVLTEDTLMSLSSSRKSAPAVGDGVDMKHNLLINTVQFGIIIHWPLLFYIYLPWNDSDLDSWTSVNQLDNLFYQSIVTYQEDTEIFHSHILILLTI